MHDRWLFALTLGAVWGGVWALCLQTPWGRWLALRRTWLAVVIGVGIDGLICLLLLPLETWLSVATVVAASSIGVIARALAHEHKEDA